MICRRLIIGTISAMAFAGAVRAAVEWQVIKVNGRDFLGVDNIANFYGFPDPVIEGKNVRLKNDKNELQFMIDSREMLINGVRNWLSYPVFVHDGKVVVSGIDFAKTLETQLLLSIVQNLTRFETIFLHSRLVVFDNG